MISEAFLKRVLMFVGVILSGLITLIFISTPESLQVPVPDNLPSITTKSSQTLEFTEAKKYFESSINDKIPGGALDSIISWSPNGKYILANLSFAKENFEKKIVTETKPYLFDMANKEYIPVPNANFISKVSWFENQMAYPAETGYGVFDIPTGIGKTFGSIQNGRQPVFSGDGSYVAYSENGTYLYSLKIEKSIQLTNEINDVPVLWKSDNKTLVFFRTTNNKSSLNEIRIGVNEIKLLAELPQRNIDAEWVTKDNLALLTLGYDDGKFDYTFNFSNNSLKLLAETSEDIAFTSIGTRELATLKGNKISLYNSDGEKVSEAQRGDRSNIANFFLLPSPSVLLIREKGQIFDSSLFNLENGNEYKLKDIWQKEVIVAPNGKSAVVVKRGSDMAEFIDIPPAS